VNDHTSLIVFLQDRLHVRIDVLSWAFLPSGLVWAVLPRYLGRVADRFGRKPLMVLGLAAAAITSFVIPHLASLVALAALWAWQALCYAAGDPAEQAPSSSCTCSGALTLRRCTRFVWFTMPTGISCGA